MPEEIFVVKSRETGRLFSTGDNMKCSVIASEMNAWYQTNEYYVEPWDHKKAGFHV